RRCRTGGRIAAAGGVQRGVRRRRRCHVGDLRPVPWWPRPRGAGGGGADPPRRHPLPAAAGGAVHGTGVNGTVGPVGYGASVIEHLSIPTPAGDFDAIAAGPQDGRPVLLLHGFPEAAVEWEHQVAR